ncbi:pentapeptide repeat-containing protein [Calothrix sp. FACHB-1219]|uniref:pentapeptide repeat-containing protein n=1 Tax=unclassified Calothrix TaxID=2619626 RepID=UPI001688CF5E|nr:MULTISPECIES: pentapeptide repeat-containing protein [unclassified Calothrix]MBD2205598.1 pentapeptide repeat-containing protein [Calothrix sp. FACHB-168]MBD2220261.1 pentapeptide repeat-containing protein [Calothrix sp. FACHB-1219]
MTQDFSGQNLRGRSFKGQNLKGANFSGADIRSADFTNTILVGANFTGAKAGLQKRWAAFLLVSSFVLSGISAYFPALIGTIIAHLFVTTSSDLANLILGTIILFLLIIFFITISRQGLNLAENFAQVFAVGFFMGLLALISGGDFANAIPISFAIGVTFAGVFAAATAFTFAGAFATAIATAITATFSEVVTFAGVFAAAGVLTYILYVGETYIFDGIGSFTYGYAVGSFVGSGYLALLSCYIARQSLKGDEKYTVIWKATIFIAAIGGTNFYNANLTNADFTGAILKSTDFREATLTCTCFYETKELDRVRPGRTYLQKKQLQELVITRDGKNKNFDHFDLRGLNLREADLENASFIDADFYEANLQEANLSRAILVRTNFERADLRSAKLTGSCIQDWVISRVTKLDGIVCDYVYLKWVDGDKRDQMPHRDTFKKGGFVFFVKYILDTIEIYHNKDIKPRLALSVLKKMSRDYDKPLDIVAVGKRGDKVFIKVKLSETVEPEQFK